MDMMRKKCHISSAYFRRNLFRSEGPEQIDPIYWNDIVFIDDNLLISSSKGIGVLDISSLAAWDSMINKDKENALRRGYTERYSPSLDDMFRELKDPCPIVRYGYLDGLEGNSILKIIPIFNHERLVVISESLAGKNVSVHPFREILRI